MSIADIARVTEVERTCWQFLRFRLVTPALGTVHLDVTGPPGTADLLASLVEA